jgi:transposase
MKFVATKTVDQLDLQAMHRVRERLVSQRTGIINQIRAPFCWNVALLFGKDCASFEASCRASWPGRLMPFCRHAWCTCSKTWPGTGAGWTSASRERDRSHRGPGRGLRPADQRARHGPIISSAIVAAIGTGDVFSRGRDFAAWLGLVPRQISTGARTILGKISKRGNRYLRVLFLQAAWVVLIKPNSRERHGLKFWIKAAKKRLHRNVLAIALANKLARIAWSVLAHGRNFEATKCSGAIA